MKSLRQDLTAQADAGDLEIRGVGIGVEHKWVEASAQAAGVLARSDVRGAVAVRGGRDDVRRQRAGVAITLGEPADERAETWHIGAGGIDQRTVNAVGSADDGPVHA